MLLEENNSALGDDNMAGKRLQKGHNKWLATFSKKAVAAILLVSLIDLQLSYALAFLGKEQIAETLSSTITETIVGVMLGYCLKALFETFFEKREERLKEERESKLQGEDEYADFLSDNGTDDDFGSDQCYRGSDQEVAEQI